MKFRWIFIICLFVLTANIYAQEQGSKMPEEGTVIELDDPELEEDSLEEGDVLDLENDPELSEEGDEIDLADDPELSEEGDEIDLADDPELSEKTKPDSSEAAAEEQEELTGDSFRDWLDQLPFELNGFIEGRAAIRILDDPAQSKDIVLGEARLQLEAAKNLEWAEIRIKSDFYYDGYREQGLVDVREANITVPVAAWLDVKAGRQILTWGVGDMVFINDLFPKDYKSLFSGRDVSYLKVPSDALKFSFSSDIANLDVIYIPEFNSDRYIDGRRISFWDPLRNDFAGRETRLKTDMPDSWFRDEEWAARLFKKIEGYELAIYGYYGFWKSPAGRNFSNGRGTFPDLAAAGFSARGEMFGGIVSFETGYYYSLDDKDGDDFLIRNSEWRFLVGYERELFRNFTAAIQFYSEWVIQYSTYKRNLPTGLKPDDELYQLITLRLTWLLMDQNLVASFFGYYSPSDNDTYLRPNLSYKITDSWKADIGANVFLGDEKQTFFTQFHYNNNIYAGLRWSF